MHKITGRGLLLAVTAVAIFLAGAIPAGSVESPSDKSCRPTPEDALGPFYKPEAPYRAAVGKGYVVEGTVRSAKDCSVIPGATIEFWLAGPEGEYDDAYRARVKAGPDGAFRFESDRPPPYWQRPPHIHIRVTAPGYHTLVTQHYPKSRSKEALFDLVLLPEQE